MACYICQGSQLFQFLDLGHQPPSDAFLKQEQLNEPEATYPLRVAVCKNCFLAQLTYRVDPEILFRDYVYTSGTNNSLRVNFKSLVDLVVGRFGLTTDDLAVDIGSNDGTLLENYLSHGVKVLGIDPSSATSIAIEKGLPTMTDFFNEEVAIRAREKYGAAKIITATNVFAHVDALDSFMRGITRLLADDGIFISESHYLLDLITKTQYDAVYHEHLRYYSLKPLKLLFEEFGMEIIDAERITTHGGSIRVYAAKKGSHQVAPAVLKLIKEEEEVGLYKLETFVDYGKKVRQNKLILLEMIVKIRREGSRIVGIGAPAKGNTLLNYCCLDSDLVDYLVEKSALKIGLFAPGTRIPVVAEARLIEERPEYALLLSWNIADELIPKIRAQGYQGKFIVPNPIPHIV